MASDSSTRTANPIVAFLGIAAAFVIVPVVMGGWMAAHRPVNQVELRRATLRSETRAKLDAEAQAKLDSEGWVDKAKGTVHVPIAQAMTLVVADLAAKKPAPSSVKVEAPLPMPVADPNATEPPPLALPSAPQGADTIRFAPPAAAAEKPGEAAPVIPPDATPRPPLINQIETSEPKK